MLYDNKATNQKKPRPNCDMCIEPEPAAVDGKTDFGPWAYMCIDHYTRHGVGLGMGLGQVLLCDDGHDPLLRARYDLVDKSFNGPQATETVFDEFGPESARGGGSQEPSPGDPHQALIDDGTVEF